RDLSLTIGYAGNAGAPIKSRNYQTISRTFGSSSPNEETVALDSTEYIEGAVASIKMPMTHRVGISINKGTDWLIGADVYQSKWSDLTIGGASQELKDRMGVAIGAQYTPDITSLSYLKLVDYRVGF